MGLQPDGSYRSAINPEGRRPEGPLSIDLTDGEAQAVLFAIGKMLNDANGARMAGSSESTTESMGNIEFLFRVKTEVLRFIGSGTNGFDESVGRFLLKAIEAELNQVDLGQSALVTDPNEITRRMVDDLRTVANKFRLVLGETPS